MKFKSTLLIALLFGMVMSGISVSAAADASVTVSDQPVVDGTVTVDEVVYNTTGWIVIHADAEGAPGTILGYSNISAGSNKDVVVKINTTGVTTTLYAMLHTDAGNISVFEFPGADVPVKDNGAVITPSFTVTDTLVASVTVEDQIIYSDNNVTVSEVVSPGPGWIVIHADASGSPGTILGKEKVDHGVNTNVRVYIDSEGRTETLYAMLHTDNGTIGEFEFPGVDAPVKDADGNVITPSFKVLPVPDASVTVEDQVVVDGKVTIKEVKYPGDGWIVIHADASGAPGSILGYTAISAGTNDDVVVKIASEGRTDTLYAMLHTDKGMVGTFEFPGDDVPVKDADGKVITPSFTVEGTMESSVTVSDQTIVSDTVTVTKVVSAGPGWIVIHADNDGSPGAILGKEKVKHGVNDNVVVTLATEGRTDTLYAMLHADNGTRGEFEFPDGADGPVKDADGNIITPSFSVAEAASESESSPGLTFFLTLMAIFVTSFGIKRRINKQ